MWFIAILVEHDNKQVQKVIVIDWDKEHFLILKKIGKIVQLCSAATHTQSLKNWKSFKNLTNTKYSCESIEWKNSWENWMSDKIFERIVRVIIIREKIRQLWSTALTE